MYYILSGEARACQKEQHSMVGHVRATVANNSTPQHNHKYENHNMLHVHLPQPNTSTCKVSDTVKKHSITTTTARSSTETRNPRWRVPPNCNSLQQPQARKRPSSPQLIQACAVWQVPCRVAKQGYERWREAECGGRKWGWS